LISNVENFGKSYSYILNEEFNIQSNQSYITIYHIETPDTLTDIEFVMNALFQKINLNPVNYVWFTYNEFYELKFEMELLK
jgi:hypothetical protein